MKRKIEQSLLQWKQNPNRKPLVVKGCRQCGKTYSVLSFAHANYEHVIYLNFHEQPSYKKFFQGALDVQTITMLISAAFPTIPIVPGKTCFVLDEIQECPRARTALKFFKLDGQYDVLCTGSLLGVNGYRNDLEDMEAAIPVGYEQIVDMYPMDFEEWLWAIGLKDEIFQTLRQSFEQETPVPESLHDTMSNYLLQYAVVGGMPEAVNTFVKTHNMQMVLDVQRGIVDGYRSDMIKYASKEDKARIRACFDSIPKQLSKENKKFQYSTIRTGARAKDYWSCLQWIEDAGIIRRCYNLQMPELPLAGNAIDNVFKVYMADTGLFVSMLEDGTQADILQGDLLGYKGAIFENLLADFLGKMQRPLYYYHKEGGLEIDFVMRYKGECTLLECKATTGQAKSLRTILNNPDKYHIYQAIKVGSYNIGKSDSILTIPHYLAFCL